MVDVPVSRRTALEVVLGAIGLGAASAVGYKEGQTSQAPQAVAREAGISTLQGQKEAMLVVATGWLADGKITKEDYRALSDASQAAPVIPQEQLPAPQASRTPARAPNPAPTTARPTSTPPR